MNSNFIYRNNKNSPFQSHLKYLYSQKVKKKDLPFSDEVTKKVETGAISEQILYQGVVEMFNIRFPRRNFVNLDQAFGMGSPWIIGQEFNKIAQNERLITYMIDKGVIPVGTTALPEALVKKLREKFDAEHNPENDYHD